jgi:tRNA A22 N-methylase
MKLSSSGHKVVAVENKKGPFENLFSNVMDNGFADIECVLADGIDYLPPQVDCCCILGMGGATIYEILSKHVERLEQFNSLIISPQSRFSMPIEFLYEHGFYNDNGLYIYEKRYYPILRFVKGNKVASTLERKYGPFCVQSKDPILLTMLHKEIQEASLHIQNEEGKKKYFRLLSEVQEIEK